MEKIVYDGPRLDGSIVERVMDILTDETGLDRIHDRIVYDNELSLTIFRIRGSSVVVKSEDYDMQSHGDDDCNNPDYERTRVVLYGDNGLLNVYARRLDLEGVFERDSD